MGDSNLTTSIPLPTNPTFKNLIGQVFGRLTVISYAGQDRYGHVRWRCLCECGGETISFAIGLRKGTSQSCGCLRKEATAKRFKTHEASNTKAYRAWRAIHERCQNSKNPSFEYYGDRGISVCERWEIFENFFADMGLPPTTKHSLDRIDNSKGYSPENCRWATAAKQNRNKRNNRILTYKGKTLCVADWADETGIPSATIISRLNRGWSVSESLFRKKDAEK